MSEVHASAEVGVGDDREFTFIPGPPENSADRVRSMERICWVMRRMSCRGSGEVPYLCIIGINPEHSSQRFIVPSRICPSHH